MLKLHSVVFVLAMRIKFNRNRNPTSWRGIGFFNIHSSTQTCSIRKPNILEPGNNDVSFKEIVFSPRPGHCRYIIWEQHPKKGRHNTINVHIWVRSIWLFQTFCSSAINSTHSVKKARGASQSEACKCQWLWEKQLGVQARGHFNTHFLLAWVWLSCAPRGHRKTHDVRVWMDCVTANKDRI